MKLKKTKIKRDDIAIESTNNNIWIKIKKFFGKKRNIYITIGATLAVILTLCLIIFPWGILKTKIVNPGSVENIDAIGEQVIDVSTLPPDPYEITAVEDETKLRNPGPIAKMTPIVKVAQKDPNVYNILLLGLDGNNALCANRSDSIVLVSVNKKNQTIKMASFMRDQKVKLPNWSSSCKLNEVYAFGGPGNTINTINYLYDLDIQQYIIVDFTNFENVVNVAGGVTVDVKTKEIPHIPGVTKAGIQQLTGAQAFAYARIRKIDSDWNRQVRQRTVLLSLLSKFMQTDIITKRNIIDSLLPLVTTNFSRTELIGFGLDTMNSMKTTDIPQYTVPDPDRAGSLYSISTEGGWYIIVNFAGQKVALNNFLYNKNDNVPYSNMNSTTANSDTHSNSSNSSKSASGSSSGSRSGSSSNSSSSSNTSSGSASASSQISQSAQSSSDLSSQD